MFMNLENPLVSRQFLNDTIPHKSITQCFFSNLGLAKNSGSVFVVVTVDFSLAGQRCL